MSEFESQEIPSIVQTEIDLLHVETFRFAGELLGKSDLRERARAVGIYLVKPLELVRLIDEFGTAFMGTRDIQNLIGKVSYDLRTFTPEECHLRLVSEE
ncbi:MAG TPA: hypothetical protein VLF63_01665 [Patescibacteria group bacterium]|nr:hypothetical protein [Patescibacteria group bacterium]